MDWRLILLLEYKKHVVMLVVHSKYNFAQLKFPYAFLGVADYAILQPKKVWQCKFLAESFNVLCPLVWSTTGRISIGLMSVMIIF